MEEFHGPRTTEKEIEQMKNVVKKLIDLGNEKE